MGGHGGLNILPQKKWNVYRADRQFEVKYDEQRDIERRLAAGEKRKRERLTDSLVELRRKSQAVKNIEANSSDPDRSQDDEDHHKKRSRRERRSRRHSDHEKSINKKTESRRPTRDLEPPLSITAADENDDDRVEDKSILPASLEFDKKVTGGHINLFEDAEREAEEAAKKHRENLIRSGAYVYNSGVRGPRTVNVYTDDTSVTLVPDFKEVSTPWYMKHKDAETEYPAKIERKGRPRYLSSAPALDLPSAYREEEELKKSFAEKLTKFYNTKSFPRI